MQRLPLALVLLLLAPMAFAQIYTWTDAGGTVHYSEAPPAAGIHYKQIMVNGSTRPDAPTSRAPAKTDAAADQASTAPAAPAQQLPDNPANRNGLCETLTTNLATLRGASPVVMKQDGKDIVLAASQRQAQLGAAEAQYQQYCQKPQ